MNKKIYLWLCIVILLSACQGEKPRENTEIVEKVISVEVESPKMQELDSKTILAGNVTSDELVLVTPKITMPATITAVNYSEGDWVNQGDVLMRFKISGLDDQISIAQAQYNLALANYQAQLENYNFAVQNLERTKILYENGAVSKVALEQAELQASPSQVNALKQQLNQAKNAYDVQLNRAEDKTLISPVSGRVTGVNAVVGSTASVQSSISIIKDGKLAIDFSLPEARKSQVLIGDVVTVNLNADQESYSAHITSISQSVQAQTGMFLASALLDDVLKDNSKVYAGMNADVILSSKGMENLTIPVDALIKKGDEEYVFLAKDGIAKKTAVKSGYDNGEAVEIFSGLSLEDKIIVVGQDFLKEDDKINIVGDE